MVGFADSAHISKESHSFLTKYCQLTHEKGELQCLCNDHGDLYGVYSDNGFHNPNPLHSNVKNLADNILPIIENAKGSTVRTSVRLSSTIWQYIPYKPLDGHRHLEQVSTAVYPVFQGKLRCDLYNVTFKLSKSIIVEHQNSQKVDKSSSSVGYCLVDARTGLFLDSNPTLQDAIDTPEDELMKSRCDEIGMKDLLLMATLNANRRSYFQSQLNVNSPKQWFISKSIIIDERECIEIWFPGEIDYPENELMHHKLAQSYCENWSNKPDRVLICDDNELLVDTCAAIMDWAGIKYDIALNGKEALQHLQFASYNCIFLDLNMPKLNGFDTARLIRNSKTDYKSIPIVAMTGTPSKPADLSRQLKNFDSILQKPFDIEDVKQSIEQAIENLQLKTNTYHQLQSTEERVTSHQQGPTAGSFLPHSDYEPTPFMIQFCERETIIEELREHILETMEKNLNFLSVFHRDPSLERLEAFLQRNQSMGTSIGAWKLAVQFGVFHQKLNQLSRREVIEEIEIVERCIHEAICFYNTVNWRTFAASVA